MTEYTPAPAVARIATKLIAEHHTHLKGVDIRYVYRDEHAKKNGKAVAGTARKKGGLDSFLAAQAAADALAGVVAENGVGVDIDGATFADDFFVIEIALDFWERFDNHQRVALVDHELCHCVTDYDKDGLLVLKILGHDLEEFRGVVERHGLWQPDLEEFAESIDRSQGRLFEGDAA